MELATSYRELFDDIFSWDAYLHFDEHLIKVSKKIDQTHIFFLGVNYLIDITNFLEVWRFIAGQQFIVDLTCIANTTKFNATGLVVANSVDREEILQKCGLYLVGISANIFARKYFVARSTEVYSLGTQWRIGASEWLHAALSFKIVQDQSSFKFYTSRPVVYQNPISINLKKAWHNPPELPIFVRLQYYKIILDLLQPDLYKFVGVSSSLLSFDKSIAIYGSKLALTPQLFSLLYTLLDYCPSRFKLTFVLSIVSGLAFKFYQKIVSAFNLKTSK